MFKLTCFSTLVFAAMITSTHANAAFVSTDWQTAGDKSATLDTNTGLEWLDLTVLKGRSYADISEALSTTLKGWRFPTSEELHTMMSSLFSSLTSLSSPESSYQNYEDLNDEGALLFSLFGKTSSTQMSTNILHRSESGLFYRVSVTLMDGLDYLNYFSLAGSFGTQSMPSAGSFFLVSDGGTTLSSINNPMLNIKNPQAPINQGPADVSVHASLGVLGLLLIAFGFRRRVSN